MKYKYTNIDDFIEWLQIKFPALVKGMRESNHHYDIENEINPYHIEGDVWTHTMCVATVAKLLYNDKLTHIASVLHDVGKPLCEFKNHNKKRASFHGHEPVSAYVALNILKEMELTDEEIVTLFQVLALHTEPFKVDHDKLADRLQRNSTVARVLNYTNKCDQEGRFHKQGQSSGFYKDISNEVEQDIYTEEVIMMFGLPNSGKSTYYENNLTHYTLLSRDQILEEITEGNDYNEKWKKADQKQVDKIFNERLQKAINNRENVVIDRTNLSRKSRRKILSRFPKSYKKSCVAFIVPLSVIFDRDAKRIGKHISQDVYEKMCKSMYPPLHDEFYDIKWVVNMENK